MDRHRLGGRAEAFLLLPFQARSLFIDLITNGVERGDWGLKGGAGESLYSCKPAPAPHNCDVCGDVLDCGCAPGGIDFVIDVLARAYEQLRLYIALRCLRSGSAFDF